MNSSIHYQKEYDVLALDKKAVCQFNVVEIMSCGFVDNTLVDLYFVLDKTVLALVSMQTMRLFFRCTDMP